MKNRLFAALLILTLLALPIHQSSVAAEPSAPAQPAPSVKDSDGRPVPNTYIIQLTDQPLASYSGARAGLAATRPQATNSKRLNVNSAESVAYRAYLVTQQAHLLQTIGERLQRAPEPLYAFQTVYNGLVLQLTEAEAKQVTTLPGVLAVTRDQWYSATTDTSPGFIGATALWDGSATGGLPGTKGDGIIVGVIDTGIWPEHLSFADDGSYAPPPARWHGTCQKPSDGTTWILCNNKLIGAQHFLTGYVAAMGGVYDGLFYSARDDNGHGTHTASTAAGNEGVAAQLFGMPLGNVSGIAPRAYVAAYKALGPHGGVGSDLMAAIDKAVADGVDVINYSIGGPSGDPWRDASALAFLNAREAGVFAAVSAGNSGANPSTLGSPGDAPWVTTVAASTSNRAFLSEITLTPTLTNSIQLYGASLMSGVNNLRLVDAGHYTDTLGLNGRLCLNPFPAGTFTAEQVVLCERGENGRVAKGDNVKAGGAGGVILMNNEPGMGLVTDNYSLPAVHVPYEVGAAIRAHLAVQPVVTITFTAGHGVVSPDTRVHPDEMAEFSSRGPVRHGRNNYLKPNITGPGVQTLAGTTPKHYSDGPQNQLFMAISGTSMSSPHMAGAAALLVALHPDWTPAQIEAALMTTALTQVVKEDGVTPADPFDLGAGRMNLFAASRTGLLFDETKAHYLAANPALGGDASQLNTPSLANGQCLAECAWTRIVSNPLTRTVTWTVSVSLPAGISLTVTPAQFTLAPGLTQTLQVDANVEGYEPDGQWVFGRLTLTPNDNAIPTAGLPIAILPTGSILPDRVLQAVSEKSGATTTQVTARSSPTLTVSTHGLVLGTVLTRALTEDSTPTLPFDNLSDGSTLFLTFTVPTGAARLVAETLASTALDLDLYLGTGATPSEATQLCASKSPIPTEYCNVNAPQAGTWWVVVQNWKQSANAPDLASLVYAVVGAETSDLTASAPVSATAQAPFNVALNWTTPAARPQDRFYGAVALGSDPAHPTNIGYLNLDVHYVGRALTTFASQTTNVTVKNDRVVTHTIYLNNTGDIPLTWNAMQGADSAVMLAVDSSDVDTTPIMLNEAASQHFARANTGRAAALLDPNFAKALNADVTWQLDDNTAEDTIGETSGKQIIWLNRFTPSLADLPFALTDVQVLFQGLGGLHVGETVDVYVYQDTDGDHDPGTGAVLRGALRNAVIQAVDGVTFSTFRLSAPILIDQPGDVLIALVNRRTGIGSATNYPAAIDFSSSARRSWVGLYSAGAPADPPVLPADTSWLLVDQIFMGGGNWMIRGLGQKCGAVRDVPWLTVSPLTGTVPAGSLGEIQVRVDPSGLAVNNYHGQVCLTTNATGLADPLLRVNFDLAVVDHYAVYVPLVSK